MRPGPPPPPRLQIDPDFRAFVRAAMSNGYRSWMLAQLAGFSQGSDFSAVLHSQRGVPATALVRARLQRVADLLEYRGRIFVEGHEEVRA
jgi:hypothetical protein